MSELICGDCIEKMRRMPENSADAIVTDPPYGLEFMGKEWDTFPLRDRGERLTGSGNPTEARGFGKNVAYGNSRKALLGLQQFTYQWATEALRLLKPGGYLLSFGGTRTYHRMACAVEDAGFEIRDMIEYMYGSGFPKSHDISKAIDKKAGVKRALVKSVADRRKDGTTYGLGHNGNITSGKGITPEAKQRQGWGTALKPAHEPIVLARKPLSEKTVAANVLKWGTGGVNVDGCKIGTEAIQGGRAGRAGPSSFNVCTGEAQEPHEGRWPANVVLDEEAAKMLDEMSGTSKTRPHDGDGKKLDTRDMGWGFRRMPCNINDSGGASRFFYCAKASRKEREAGLKGVIPCCKCGGLDTDTHIDKVTGKPVPCFRNDHPTVKPISLMRWLCRLITPPGGLILDLFMGSGSTGCAAVLEGFKFTGIDNDPHSCRIAGARITHYLQKETTEQLGLF